jgi:hypothetical protein
MDNDTPIRFLAPPEGAERAVALDPSVDALDPVSFALLAAIVLGLALYGVLAARRRPAGAPAVAQVRCRWRQDKRRHGATLQRFTCTACGMEGYSAEGRAPRQCKRAFRPASL